MAPKKTSRGGDRSSSYPATVRSTLLLSLVFIELSSGFVQGFYTPLLPQLAAHLSVPVEAMNWFQTVQAIAAAVMVPLMSRMGDIFGPRRTLVAALAMVLAGTVIIALVPTYPAVLAGRVLVGPLGVWLPLIIAVIYVRMSPDSKTRSISIVSASLMAGIVIGTVSAGLDDYLLSSLVAVLLFPCLMVAVSLILAVCALPRDLPTATGRIDWLGFIGLGAVMVLFILGLSLVGPSHAGTAGVLFAAATVVFLAWIAWERRAPDPAVDLEIVVSRQMGPLYVTAFVLGIVMIDAAPNLADFLSRDPAKLGYGFAATTDALALIIAAMLLLATIGAFSSTLVAQRVGMRPMLMTGAGIGALGQMLLMVFPFSYPMVWVSGMLTGFGLGLLVGTLPALVAHAAPAGRTGIANGIYAALLAMGGAVGGAVFKQVVIVFRDDAGVATLGGFMAIWGVIVGAFVIAFVMMATVRLTVTEPTVTAHS